MNRSKKSSNFDAQTLVASAQKASDLFEKKIIDPAAQTANEIAQDLGFFTSNSTCRKAICEKVRAGLLEQVWTRRDGRLMKGYRLLSKARSAKPS